MDGSIAGLFELIAAAFVGALVGWSVRGCRDDEITFLLAETIVENALAIRSMPLHLVRMELEQSSIAVSELWVLQVLSRLVGRGKIHTFRAPSSSEGAVGASRLEHWYALSPQPVSEETEDIRSKQT